jgi:hypothetical protein
MKFEFIQQQHQKYKILADPGSQWNKKKRPLRSYYIAGGVELGKGGEAGRVLM